MHTEKNVFENIFNTVMDTSKTKDNIKARMDIEKYCDRADMHVWKQNNKVLKTKASYTLSKPQVKKELHIKDLETLKDNIVVTLCKLEKVFPPGLFDSMEHLVIHLVNKAINGGLEQYKWRGRSRGSHLKSSTSRSIPIGRGGSSIVGRRREIANEWSPRGRGNNSSSGNGRDIPDECSPIGRGSNNTSGNGMGRADNCSPRGRGSNNTSGNGRGMADDINPKGRGSNNRDISDDCSPIGRAGSSIDVHEDDEEHVEHVVGSSQNQVGSNITPSSSLPKLWLVGGVFYDPAISRHAGSDYSRLCSRVLTLHEQKFPKTIVIGTFYRWEDAESNQIRDAWESHMKNRYNDIMRGVRKAAMKVTRVNDNVDIGRISSNRPIWIGAADWQPMVNVWDTDE
uniref:DUF4218 domain-containing protein n=1 Tax=Tanacetum cinerariifolium TaxID=118510 RepID=A0A6L2MN46_TANCI|nr:hypothetical protein [Tanacetum cinerariifolium]